MIAIERIFGALKRKFVKDGGYSNMGCQVSKRGIQILGIFFSKTFFHYKTCAHKIIFVQMKKKSSPIFLVNKALYKTLYEASFESVVRE